MWHRCRGLSHRRSVDQQRVGRRRSWSGDIDNDHNQPVINYSGNGRPNNNLDHSQTDHREDHQASDYQTGRETDDGQTHDSQTDNTDHQGEASKEVQTPMLVANH